MRPCLDALRQDNGSDGTSLNGLGVANQALRLILNQLLNKDNKIANFCAGTMGSGRKVHLPPVTLLPVPIA